MNRYYVAGLFEGEGSVMVKRNNGGLSRTVVVRVRMCDREPLNVLAETVGGKVRGPYNSGENHRPTYNWDMHNPAEVRALVGWIGDLLSPRRQEQFANAFMAYEAWQHEHGRSLR